MLAEHTSDCVAGGQELSIPPTDLQQATTVNRPLAAGATGSGSVTHGFAMPGAASPSAVSTPLEVRISMVMSP